MIGQYMLAFVGFIVAGISDGVDGYIALRFNQVTKLGTYLDPFADKALLMSIYLSMGILELIPLSLVIIVVSRDIMIFGAVILSGMLDKPVEIKPLWISKLNTTAQIAYAGVVLAGLGLGLDILQYTELGAVGVGALTFASGAVYMLKWMRHMANNNEHK